MRLAAINYDGSSGTLVDDVLAEAVRFLKRAGLNVAGAIQWNEPLPDRRRCSMTLEDLCFRPADPCLGGSRASCPRLSPRHQRLGGGSCPCRCLNRIRR